jgi:two-component system OmpR family sensor kinase
VEAILVQLSLVIGAVALLSVGATVGAGALIVRRALRPLERVAQAASQVSELPLDRGEVALSVRVADADADPSTEVGQVGAAINRMLGHVASALSARQQSENKVRQFVADASHELRTPLASIRGYAELTRMGNHDLPDDVVHAIGRVESEAKRMTSLVEELLLLARLDEGRELQRQPFDITRMLVDAVSDAHAAGPDHEWSLDQPDEPVIVTGDAPRLQQAVANLLANARVHTPVGTSVEVALAVAADAVTITVTDNGPGIDQQLQDQLFERFARGDRSRSRMAGSTGLGLAIVRAVVAGHGGTVTVSSRPGHTVFTVVLPR